MINKAPILLFIILLIACSPAKDQDGVNFLVKENGDTLSFFFYPVYDDYEFVTTSNYDSTILGASTSNKIPGVCRFGVVGKNKNPNRFLLVQGEVGSTFDVYWNAKEFFLHDSYNLNDYRVEVVYDWVDSTRNPMTMHSMLAAIDQNSLDTILFQEMNYEQRQDYVGYNLVVYATRNQRLNMRSLLDDAIAKIYESAGREEP
ncbi:MAG: hypothetical protein RJQ14_06525 [Marinoscillum sp.]